MTRRSMHPTCMTRLARASVSASAAASLKASGRCLFARPVVRPGTSGRWPRSSHQAFQGDEVELIELSRSSLPNTASRGAGGVPSSLAGNSYYETRYQARPQRRGTNASLSSSGSTLPPCSSSSLSSFRAGDLVVHALRSVAPAPLRQTPMVDVTGVRTSFLDASERDERRLQTVDEAIHTMHLHDGGEVPALRRGDVAIGQLSILVAYTTEEPGLLLSPVDNAALALLGRRGQLTFRQDEEALQVARRLANAYTHPPRGRVWSLRPVLTADGHLLSFRLM